MVYECRNNHATFSAAYCPTCDAIARADAAEATLASCNRARQAAEAECERLREQVDALTQLWQRAIDADILDDAHELGNAIADASAVLNYPLPGDDEAAQDAA